MSEEFEMFKQEIESYNNLTSCFGKKENNKAEKKVNYNDTEDRKKEFDYVNNFEDVKSCIHENIISEKGITICIDCGEEIQSKISSEKEWRYYGNNDTKHSSDPTRVQARKNDERHIFRDVETLGFSENIVAKANVIYSQVTKGKIFRGNSRKAIIFACIFHAYKMSGKAKSHETLIKIFGLSRRTGLKGLKFVNRSAPKDSKIRTTYITPIDLIDEIMDNFSSSKEQRQEVIDLYKEIQNKSSKLNRSRPQSVSSGLVYYWVKMNRKDISLKDFVKKVSLSELTVNKIVKEIESIMEPQK